MYYIYGISGPSLLIESTNSNICTVEGEGVYGPHFPPLGYLYGEYDHNISLLLAIRITI